MKEVFGVTQATALLAELEAYSELYGSEREVVDGLKILESYLTYHSTLKKPSIIRLQRRFESLRLSLNISLEMIAGDCFGFYVPQTSIIGRHFRDFFSSRFSVRNFSTQVIPISQLRELAHLAGRSPSACNRQPWRVRIIQDPGQILKALSFQNGNRGFTQVISNLVIVTGVISNFSSKERHQVFIDCGLYSMSFMMALHANGIASCPLNMSNQSGDEIQISRALKFSEDEVPIMMIALGIAAEGTKTANSERKPECDFIYYNSL
jgi:nitroreductase